MDLEESVLQSSPTTANSEKAKVKIEDPPAN